MKRTIPKQFIMKEVKDELQEILLEKEEAEQAKREAESEWAKAYEEDFRREQQREEEEYLEKERFIREFNSYYEEPKPPT